MPEFFLELFSEEIPARMQARAADDLARLIGEALAALSPSAVRSFHGPRRIALAARVAPEVAAASSTERGPRASAPEQALTGFLRKHAASREQLRVEGDYWVLDKRAAAVSAASLIGQRLPDLLRRFPWPKSMRWGGASGFTWVRPLRRITCLLDGAVIPFDLRDGADDGHGLVAANLTEGHRFHAPGAVAVLSCDDWAAKLRERRVLVDAEERKRRIAEGVARLAAERSFAWWTIRACSTRWLGWSNGRCRCSGGSTPAYMDLPPEVRQVSMRVNQRYFALRSADGSAAPVFALRRQYRAGRRRRGHHRRQRTRAARPLRRCAAFLGPRPQGAAGKPGAEVGPGDVPRQARQPGRPGAPAGSAGRAHRPAGGRRPGAGARRGAAVQGRSRHRHGRRISRTARRDGPLLRAARRRGSAGRRRHP